jgi:hypothetical protein
MVDSCRAAHTLRFNKGEVAVGRTERNIPIPFSEIGSRPDSSRRRFIGFLRQLRAGL